MISLMLSNAFFTHLILSCSCPKYGHDDGIYPQQTTSPDAISGNGTDLPIQKTFPEEKFGGTKQCPDDFTRTNSQHIDTQDTATKLS